MFNHQIKWFVNSDVWVAMYGYFIVRGVCLIAMMCSLFVFWKFYTSKDGNFRRKMLYFWASLSFWLGVLGFAYHPYLNDTITTLSAIPFIGSLFWLAAFILRYFGVRGNFRIERQRPPEPTELDKFMIIYQMVKEMDLEELKKDWSASENPPGKSSNLESSEAESLTKI